MEIVSGIHNVDGVNGNCYLISCGKDWALLDTGLPNNAKKILSYVDGLKIKPSDIKTIIITHAHIDHIGNAATLKKITGAKIAVHQDDADFIAGRKKLVLPSSGIKLKFLLIRFLSPFFKAAPVQPDILLNDKDEIAGLKVIHTPGHTPGSICLLDSKRKVLFVGDLIRFMDGEILGPPITMDVEQVQKSIGKIAGLAFEIMLSGHGQPLRPKAAEKVQEYYSRIYRSPA